MPFERISPLPPISARRHGEPYSQGIEQLPNGVITDLGTRREGFVQALSSQARVLGYFGGATCLGDIRHGVQKDIRISVFQRGRRVLGNDLLVVRARKAWFTALESGNISATSRSSTTTFAPLSSRRAYLPRMPAEKS